MWCKRDKLKQLINFVFVKFFAYLLCVELTFYFCGRNLVCFGIAHNFNAKFAPERGKTRMRTAFFTRAGFEWTCKHKRLRPEPIRFVRLDSEHARSDGKSVNRGLPLLDLARGRASWC